MTPAGPSSPELKLSVIVPTHRRAENLMMLLDSLSKQTLDPGRFEVIVVDDHSGDDTVDVLHAAHRSLPNLCWITMESNVGQAIARNRGIDDATGDVVLFLDDDVAATPDLLARHLRFHEERNDSRWGLLGKVDWHPSLKVTPFMRWLDGTGLQFSFETWLKEGEVDEPHRAMVAAHVSVRRSMLIDVGGFNERFRPPFISWEDFELAWRMGKRGFRLMYLPQALAYHTRPVDLWTFRRRIRVVARSTVLLKTLHPDFPLAEVILGYRLAPRRRLKLLAYAPLAWLRRDEQRLGRLWWGLVAAAYEEGKEEGVRMLAADNAGHHEEEAPRTSSC